MYPYRLEMGTKFKTERGDNLYDFWGSTISNSINRISKENKSKAIVIQRASGETSPNYMLF